MFWNSDQKNQINMINQQAPRFIQKTKIPSILYKKKTLGLKIDVLLKIVFQAKIFPFNSKKWTRVLA